MALPSWRCLSRRSASSTWRWGGRPSTRADMAIELVCSCGRVVRRDQPPAGGQTRCPACGAVVSPEANLPAGAPSADQPAQPGARKPLWALMGKAPASPPGPAGPETVDRLEVKEREGSPVTPAPSTMAREPEGATAAEGPTTGLSPGETGSAPARKGLWGVMQTTPPAPLAKSEIQNPISEIPAPKSEIRNPKSEIPIPPGSASASEPRTAPDDPLADVFGIPPVEAES